MTDTVGPVEIEILSVFKLSERSVMLSGDLSTEENRTALEELFRDAEVSGYLHDVPLNPLWEDFSDSEVYTQYCIIDSDRLKDGWYGLVKFKKGEEVSSMYPYEIQLVFIGTSAVFSAGSNITDIEDVTNDWSM